MQIVLMGVAGSGKSSIGSKLAIKLALPFVDGDDLHPKQNLMKMTAGVPLEDDDRWPWLDLCGLTLQMEAGAVIACSALKRSYRDRIRSLAPQTVFIHLAGSEELLLERLNNRKGHFMKPWMLTSQLETLEPLAAGEVGFSLEIDRSEADVVDEAMDFLAKLAPAR